MPTPFVLAPHIVADVYRTPPMSGTPPTRGSQAVVATAAIFTPFAPVSAIVAAANNWDAPFELRQTVTETEVREGDVIIPADGLSYDVLSSAVWTWPSPGSGISVYHVTMRQPRV